MLSSVRTRRMPGVWYAVAALAVCLAMFAPVRAQEGLPGVPAVGANGSNGAASSAANGGELPTAEGIEAARAALGTELAEAEAALAAASAEGAEPPKALSDRVDTLRRIGTTLTQQASELGEIAATAEASAEIEARRATFGEEELRFGDVSFLDIEGAREQLRLTNLQIESRRSALDATRSTLDRARESLAERQAERRRAADQLQGNTDAARNNELTAAVRRAELAERLAQRTLELAELSRASESASLEVAQAEAELLADRVAQLRTVWRPSAADRRATLEAISTQRRQPLIERKTQVEGQRSAVARELDRFGASLRQRVESDPAAAAQLESLETRLAAYDAVIESVDARLARLALAESLVERRFAVLDGSLGRQEMFDTAEEVRGEIQTLRDERVRLETRLSDRRRERQSLESRITAARAAEPARDDVADALTRAREAIDDRITALEASLAQIDQSIAFRERLIDDVDEITNRKSLDDWISDVWHVVLDVWNYDLKRMFVAAQGEDIGYPVGKLLIGVFLLIGGVFASRAASRVFSLKILGRTKLDVGAVAAIRSIFFYVLIVAFALFALRVVGIPLTVFTVLGGALAIGIGFGSQNIVNNFISGLILIAERPIRVGDFVQVDDLSGTVESIGTRSTRIRTPLNIEMIIPNSQLLENRVVNWTLTDRNVGLGVEVGVAYGSDTRQVITLLQKAAVEHGKVLKSPPPRVFFDGFGDNALVFKLWFTVNLANLVDRIAVPSDLRHRIDVLFREAGIEIAFPQRDVHLDQSEKPFRIELTRQAREVTPQDPGVVDTLPGEPSSNGSPAGEETTAPTERAKGPAVGI